MSDSSQAAEGFKLVLLQAATQAHKNKQITAWQLFRIRMAVTFNSKGVYNAQKYVIQKAIEKGLITEAEALVMVWDWQKFFELVLEYLPIIIQLIMLLI